MIDVSPNQRVRNRAGLISVVIGVAILVLKLGAFLVTGSATILSDALESVVHVAATVIMYWCLRVAARNPDADHPYGHGKVEYFSIGFEGGTILLAALGIVWESVRALHSGHPPENLGLGFWLIAASVVINVTLGIYLVYIGRRTASKILIADGYHVLSDVVTSVGVLLGVGIMWYLPPGPTTVWIDGGLAIFLAALLVLAGVRLMRQSLRGLMDEADPLLLQTVVGAINEIRDPDWMDIHNLRVLKNGDLTFVEFHMVLPAQWTIVQGHDASEQLEKHILLRLKTRGSVMIHLDHSALSSFAARVVDAESRGMSKEFTLESATCFYGHEDVHQ